MQRDLDLIRMILLRLEASKEKEIDPTPPEGCDWERFGYHLEILEEAEFVVMTSVTTFEGTSYHDCRLTWNGHEYLDAVRNDDVWSRVKEKAAPLGPVPVAVIAELAMAVVKQLLGV